MKKIILKPIAFSMILAGFLSSFGGCSDDKISSNNSFEANSTFGCISDQQLFKASFEEETAIDNELSEYTFKSDETREEQTIKFKYASGELNESSSIALSTKGTLDSYTITEVKNLLNGQSIYTLSETDLLEGSSNREEITLKSTDCSEAFSNGQKLQIHILR